MNHKLKLLAGMLTVGTVFPACQMAEKSAQEKDTKTMEKTELRSTPGAEIKPTPEKTAEKPLVAIKIEGGLKYQIVRASAADAKMATDGDAVTVHYTGWFDDGDGKIGKKFDSSHDHGQPFTFTIGAGRVIQGWEKGVSGMKVGEQRRLFIPAEFAYGKNGIPGAIPPNASLIFDVELLEVN